MSIEDVARNGFGLLVQNSDSTLSLGSANPPLLFIVVLCTITDTDLSPPEQRMMMGSDATGDFV